MLTYGQQKEIISYYKFTLILYPFFTMTRQTLTVNQYEQLQEQFNFQDQQYGSVNCYHSPIYYNNPLYFDPLSYEVE